MDTIEIARQRAEKLHYEAVGRGLNLWDSYTLAIGEAKYRGIQVEQCLKDAEELNGGRAFFDSQYRLIMHENVGSSFEQAFLVAHELGHIELGDDTHDQYVQEIDPACAASDPSVTDRIVDYNHRQRREIQMDLFAREFLLPRSVVRKLHLEDSMSCSDIASKLGAPFEVVAQQMLDAMLLPIVKSKPQKTDIVSPLNIKQLDAVNHRGAAFLLQAGPGTGKTRTLVARVESLLKDGVDPKNILLLTFSNKAAAEMSERIAQRQPETAAALWMGTFHGFGLDLLRRFHDLCNLPAEFRLIDRSEAVELLEEKFLSLNLKHYRNLYDPSQIIVDILNAISRAKDEVIDVFQYRILAQNMLDQAKTQDEYEVAERAVEVATVYEAYEEAKKQINCVDYGDLVMLPVQLLEANNGVKNQLQIDYQHVLVDEYQDVNRSSIRLLQALKPSGNNLWVVGDAKQSIYRFRGASSFNISRFCTEDFLGGITQSLEINYRSVPEIVAAFSEFAEDMKTGGANSHLSSHRSASGILPEIRTVENGDLINASLAESILQMRENGFSYRDQVVLCRGNDKLSALAQDLERLGIPVLFLGSLFERQEVKDLIALVSLLVDKRAMGLLRISCWSEFEMPIEDVMHILEHLQLEENESEVWNLSLSTLSKKGMSALKNIKAILNGFDSVSHPWEILATVLLDRTRIVADIATSKSVSGQAQGIAIWQFMNFARQNFKGKGTPVMNMMARIRRLMKLNDDRDLRQLPTAAQSIDAVRLMTIHGSKGLEFPVVHLSGLNKDTIPGSYRRSKCPAPEGMIFGGEGSSEDISREAHETEQECLFYVAMSRAQERILFYAATTKGKTKVKRPLSSFLEKIGSTTIITIQPKLQLPSIPENIKLPVDFKGDISFTANALGLYKTCPRRFLYTHILCIGGRRQETAFMQMHEAVREVLQIIIESSSPSSIEWHHLLRDAFIKFGLNEHGYMTDYLSIAEMMLNFFIYSRNEANTQTGDKLTLNIAGTKIIVNIDEILIRDDKHTIRRVFTRHAPSDVQKEIQHAIFYLAVKNAFPESYAELIYLADNTIYPLEFKEKDLNKYENQVEELLHQIHQGDFKKPTSLHNCPNCPAFFICGAVPIGTIKKNF